MSHFYFSLHNLKLRMSEKTAKFEIENVRDERNYKNHLSEVLGQVEEETRCVGDEVNNNNRDQKN